MSTEKTPEGLKELIRIFGDNHEQVTHVSGSVDKEGNYQLHVTLPFLESEEKGGYSSANALFKSAIFDSLNELILGSPGDFGDVSSMDSKQNHKGGVDFVYYISADIAEVPPTIQRLQSIKANPIDEIIEAAKQKALSDVAQLRGNQLNQHKVAAAMPWKKRAPSQALNALNEMDTRIQWQEAETSESKAKIYRTTAPLPPELREVGTEFVQALQNTLEMNSKRNAITIDEEGHVCILGALMDDHIKAYKVRQQLKDFTFRIENDTEPDQDQIKR